MDPFPIKEIIKKLPSFDDIIDKNNHNKKKSVITNIFDKNKDKMYIFGRNQELSLAELISCYRSLEIEFDVKFLSQEGIIIGTESDSTDIDRRDVGDKEKNIDFQNRNESNNFAHPSLSMMGAVLKKCIPLMVFKPPYSVKEIKERLTDYILENVFLEEKQNWALSAYNYSSKEYKNCEIASTSQLYNLVRDVIKKALKKGGIKRAFYIKPMEGRSINPMKLSKKGIPDNGFEFVLLYDKVGVVLGKTEEVLDVIRLEHEDIDRLHRRPLLQIGAGLAKTMINLTFIDKKERNSNIVIYDPFCGVGTIPQEAYIMGYTAIGSDIDGKIVRKASENIKQLLAEINKYGKSMKEGKEIGRSKPIVIPNGFGKVPAPKYFKMDIRNPDFKQLSKYLQKTRTGFVCSIVTEPDLLEPLEDYPSKREADRLQARYIQIYQEFLKGLSSILASEHYGVIVFPQVNSKGGVKHPLPVEKMLDDAGLEMVYYPLEHLRIPSIFNHSWKNPIIERQIVVFRKL